MAKGKSKYFTKEEIEFLYRASQDFQYPDDIDIMYSVTRKISELYKETK